MFKALLRRAVGPLIGHAPKDAAARDHATRLYGALVARAREARFFERFDIPDTFDGRFEALVIHMFLLSHRLKDGSAMARDVSQRIFDALIDDIDASLREAAVGDQAVPKRIAKMTQVFYGRTGALEDALRNDDRTKAVALVVARNLHPETATEILSRDRDLAGYIVAAADRLMGMAEAELFEHADPWPELAEVSIR